MNTDISIYKVRRMFERYASKVVALTREHRKTRFVTVGNHSIDNEEPSASLHIPYTVLHTIYAVKHNGFYYYTRTDTSWGKKEKTTRGVRVQTTLLRYKETPLSQHF